MGCSARQVTISYYPVYYCGETVAGETLGKAQEKKTVRMLGSVRVSHAMDRKIHDL